MTFSAIPIIRIFDEQKARDFYVGFLGMNVDWEHRFEPDAPIYLQDSRDGLVLHLSEHSGDGSPGTKLFVSTTGLEEYFEEVTARGYRYSRPAIESASWGSRVFEVIDPFSNRLIFSEREET